MNNKKVYIYNTLSRQKEIIKPLKAGRINLFVCGPTVYDFSHIGHARTYIVFDSFVKYLRKIGYKVFYVQNITNIDDKIIAKSKEKGVLPQDLASAFSKEYLKDMKAIGITSVNKYVFATSCIKEIISQIQRLKEKGYAYLLDDGLYYNIAKFKNYGKLSGRTVLAAQDAVSRIDYNKNKKNRGDFCLWKFSLEGEPSWPSPWGFGRPGWHIEDTAIAEKFFGPQYDIHGGGIDLMFPHHEAEIAQMEAISGKKPFVKYWMHTGFLTMESQKMSKSLDNFILISDFLKRYPWRHLRFWILKNLWSSPVDYSESVMIEIKLTLEKIEELIRKLNSIKFSKIKISPNKELKVIFKKTKELFYTYLSDNFNTPKAFGEIFDFIKEVNKFLDKQLIGKKDAKMIYVFFEEINKIFDIIDFKRLKQSKVPKEVYDLVKMREEYRKKEKWQEADNLRKEIEKHGFIVNDTKEGPVLKKI